MIKVAFFDAKSYDEVSFNKTNADYGFDIHYYQEHLNLKTVPLAKGPMWCAFSLMPNVMQLL